MSLRLGNVTKLFPFKFILSKQLNFPMASSIWTKVTKS